MVPDSDLPCSSVSAEEIWESTPAAISDACLWFDFRAQTTYEFEHPLGREPRIILGYISFAEDGTSSTIASGDVFLILDATDATVTIRNGQNQDFFLRLVLQ